ncbi:hypothetical protein [Nocardia jinanensis]|uniref:Uncharacterized protein n=1 Tax=Nocardia jinanensis TaxID=382504 RepID=A0A917RU86_9NOCA|nr:hypothetical protein [Nocardia jinanensis]GGL27079.1 hypothetical protein GCM10011588_47270 [Nocardia jinanensis]
MTESPRSIAGTAPALPPGADEERFAGYGVMGQPFTSGHYLAFRHFAASSVGPGYESVWHRNPAREWVIYSSVAPEASCPRYYGSALADTRVADISVTWTGPFALTVEIPDKLVWDIELGRSAATAAMTGLGGVLPSALWRSPAVLSVMSRVAGPALGVGRVRLRGTTPNGQWFRTNPRMLWTVARTVARIDGVDIGPAGPLAEQTRLGEFWLPQRGMFAVGQAYFEQYDAARHKAGAAGS